MQSEMRQLKHLSLTAIIGKQEHILKEIMMEILVQELNSIKFTLIEHDKTLTVVTLLINHHLLASFTTLTCSNSPVSIQQKSSISPHLLMQDTNTRSTILSETTTETCITSSQRLKTSQDIRATAWSTIPKRETNHGFLTCACSFSLISSCLDGSKDGSLIPRPSRLSIL